MAAPKTQAKTRVKVRSIFSKLCSHVLVFRVYKAPGGKEQRVLQGTRYLPQEVSDEGRIRELFGAGHFVLSPRTDDNRICGDEPRFSIPNADGTLPPVELHDASGPLGPSGGGRIDPWAMILQIMAEQRAQTAALLAAEREGKRSDNALMAAQYEAVTKTLIAVAQGGGAGGNDSRLAKLEKANADLLERLHQKELLEAKRNDNATQFFAEVAKAHGPKLLDRMLADPTPPPPPPPAPEPETIETAPLEKLLGQLPPVDSIREHVAAGGRLEAESVAGLVRLAEAGRLGDDYLRELRAYLSRTVGIAGK